jgi:acyl carrier protein
MVSGVASEQSFQKIFGDFFELDPTEVSLDARLVDDLGFDSIMFLEIALLLEAYADQAVDDDLLSSLLTVGDVYHYYATFKSRAS